MHRAAPPKALAALIYLVEQRGRYLALRTARRLLELAIGDDENLNARPRLEDIYRQFTGGLETRDLLEAR